MRRWLVIGSLLLSASDATQANYQRYVNSFVGQNATELYAASGSGATIPG